VKAFPLFLIGLGILLSPASSQVPAPPPKPSAPASPITVNDVRILPFCREHKEKKYAANDRQMPDELRVVVSSGKIHIVGKKRIQEKKVGGEPICHSGKVALLTGANRSGKLVMKGTASKDTTDYFAVLELADDSLSSSYVELTAGKSYDWAVKADAGTTTLRITDGATEVIAVSAPSDKVKGFGFASTVRWQNNEADLNITFE
jgi:hypothetical protein